MASAVVHSKAMVLPSFIHCCNYHGLYVVFLCWVLVLFCSALCPFEFCNHLAGEVRAGCFIFVMF